MKNIFRLKGQTLVELVLAMGLAALIFPTLLAGFMGSREGKVEQGLRMQATALLKETEQAVRGVRNNDWSTFALDGTYHTALSGSIWTLAANSALVSGFTQEVVISSVSRNTNGDIVTSGGTNDPSTKKVVITISWTTPHASSVTSTMYMTRFGNLTYSETTQAQFTAGTLTNTQVTNDTDGEIKLANNNKGKWCTPSFSTATIDLPDGPPVAVAATASATSITIPDEAFVATSPTTSNSIKLAYIKVDADTDSPHATLSGKFTLDAAQYSSPSYVPTGTGLDNVFKTNDVKYYKSSNNKKYALLATDLPNKEVIAVLIDDNDPSNNNDTSGEYADPTNKIFKYWTYFNTNIYAGSIATTSMLSPSANAAETTNAGDNDGYGSNPNRAYASDNSYAVDTNSGNGTGTNCTGVDKDKQRYYNYNVSLPSGAAIDGIEVRLEARVDNTAGTPKLCVQLSSDGGSTWTTAQSTNTLTTSKATYTLGGATDTWGRSWSDTDFSNTNFRVRVIDVASDTNRDFSLDYVGVKIYSNTSTNDQSPYGYGATAMKIFENKGYVLSGGFLYVFDLSNIDTKSTSSGLDQIGCRIQVGGATGGDCKPGSPNGSYAKYTNGQTGTTYGTNGQPSHNTCFDGGNIALYADEAIDVARVSSASNNIYAFIAIGGIVGDELSVVKAQTVPSNISSNTCGVSDGTDWKEVGNLDFNDVSGTEEAANSIYAKSDGSRVYMTSNGGTDSKQFYVLNTSTPATPKFLNGASGGIPTNGFYNGDTTANGELYPKRSLTVQNGLRAVLVGKDGVSNSNNAQEYQVVNMETPNSETSPTYCGGLDFDVGFNDLTSVSELDGDNYVYMVANTTSNELKIIQGGPDNAIFVSSGTYESSPYDAGSSVAYNSFSATINKPSVASISAQVAIAPPGSNGCSNATYQYVGPSGAVNDFYTVVGASISGTIPFNNYSPSYQNPARCFRYKTWFSTTDQTQTPRFDDMTWNYSP